MTDPRFLLVPVVCFVLLVVAAEWALTRDRPRSGPLMAANLWIALFEQGMGLLVYVGLVAVYDRIRSASPFEPSPTSLAVWMTTFIAVDAAFYAYHRFSHGTALGWALHAVHHQSPELNATAAVRNSPLGGAVQFLFHVPLALLGLPTICWVFAKGLNTLWQLLLHTEALGRAPLLDGWLNTPSSHRVHHGLQAHYRDRNLGGVLLVFDRLFGTWAPEMDRPRYGVEPSLRHADPLLAQLAPLRHLAVAVRQGGPRALLRPPGGSTEPASPDGPDALASLNRSTTGAALASMQLAAGTGLLLAMTADVAPAWIGVPSLLLAGSLAAATAAGSRAALALDALRIATTIGLVGVSA